MASIVPQLSPPLSVYPSSKTTQNLTCDNDTCKTLLCANAYIYVIQYFVTSQRARRKQKQKMNFSLTSDFSTGRTETGYWLLVTGHWSLVTGHWYFRPTWSFNIFTVASTRTSCQAAHWQQTQASLARLATTAVTVSEERSSKCDSPE